MCDQQSPRSACAYVQSDQSLCLSLEYSITVRLLTEHYSEFLILKGGQARVSLHLSKCYIIGNHIAAQMLILMFILCVSGAILS